MDNGLTFLMIVATILMTGIFFVVDYVNYQENEKFKEERALMEFNLSTCLRARDIFIGKINSQRQDYKTCETELERCRNLTIEPKKEVKNE